jgi:hypothetical protein
MAYPGTVTITVQDGGLQLVSGGANFPLVIAPSSAGTAATLYMGTDPQAFKTAVGRGPGVDIALSCIDAIGGCFFLKTAATVAGVNSAITVARIGTSTGTMTVSAGGATHDFAVKIRIKKTGTVGVGKFDYSLDRTNATADTDRTFSEEIIIPAGGTFAVPGAGFTWTFTPGGGPTFFELGDVFTGTSTCPHYNTTDLGTAITALLASPLLNNRKIRKVCFAGNPASASAAATVLAAIATHMSTLATSKHFARAMADGGSIDTSANYLTSVGGVFANSRVAVQYGLEERISPQPFAGFAIPRVSEIHSNFLRAVRAQISENLGRVASGPMDGVVAISNDEMKAPIFTEADKTNTFRTDQSGPGFFPTNGYLKSPAGSDFLYWDFGVTLDEGTTVFDMALARYRNSKVSTIRVPGVTQRPIHPVAAKQMESAINAQIAEVMRGPTVDGQPNHVEEQGATIDQTNDVFGTRIVKATWRAVPLPPMENLEATVGLSRSVAV